MSITTVASSEDNFIDFHLGGQSKGKRDFVSQLYKCYWGELCNYLSRRFGKTNPEPEEIVQRAFLKLLSIENPFNIGNPRAYLYRVAINAAIDHRRMLARQERLLLDEFATKDGQPIDCPEAHLMCRQELDSLEAAIMALSDRDRTFLILNRFDGVSYAEISRQTGMSASGVRWIIEKSLGKCIDEVKGRVKLRATLES